MRLDGSGENLLQAPVARPAASTATAAPRTIVVRRLTAKD
jgi:hypothetical protein